MDLYCKATSLSTVQQPFRMLDFVHYQPPFRSLKSYFVCKKLFSKNKQKIVFDPLEAKNPARTTFFEDLRKKFFEDLRKSRDSKFAFCILSVLGRLKL